MKVQRKSIELEETGSQGKTSLDQTREDKATSDKAMLKDETREDKPT